MTKDNLHVGHRDRVKQRFLQEGLERFDEHNVLELMLFYSVPQRDTNELAHRLINEFGSLDRVLDAPFEQLCSIDGIGANTATMLKLFPSVSRYYDVLKHKPTSIYSNGKEIADFVRAKNRYRIVETFGLLTLDAKHGYLDCIEISQGHTTGTAIDLRKTLDTLLRSKAASVVLFHNHPSGYLKPSVDDVQATRIVCDAVHVIGVRVLDHLIISDDSYYSMRADEPFSHLFD